MFKDPGGAGGFFEPRDEDGNELSEDELREMAVDMQIAAAQAAATAKAQGKSPAGVERIIGETAQETISWQDKLAKFASTHIKTDYTWARPNRRMIGQGLYLPSFKKENIGEVVIVIDTSGSVDDEQVNLFFKNINRIMDECNPDVVHVMSCDAAVHSVDSYARGEEIKPKILGQRGDRFPPAVRRGEEEGVGGSRSRIMLDIFYGLDGYFPR